MYGLKIAAIALLATAVAADNLPSCAQSCVTNYNGCSQFDVACICGSSAWIQGLACCVSQVCSVADQDATIQFANTICAGAGVTTLPQSATCASGAASSYSTGAATIGTTVGSASAVTSSTATSSGASSASSTTSTKSSSGTTVSPASNTGGANINTAGAVGLGAILAALMAAA